MEGFALQLDALRTELAELRARLAEIEATVAAKPAKVEATAPPATPVKNPTVTSSGSKPAGR